MPITDNMRPGVYSQYDVTSYYAAPRSAQHAAVVAKANDGETDKLYRFTAYAQAQEAFGADTAGKYMLGCIRVLFASGVSEVVAVPVGASYESALALVEDVENIGALVCDATDTADLNALRQSVENSAKALRERVAYCGIDAASAAIAAAGALNSERVVLACPAAKPVGVEQASAVYTAAAIAGAVLAQNDCAYNYNGCVLGTVRDVEELPEAEIQALLAAGVCVAETVNGSIELIRALTTRTNSGGTADRTFLSLNTTLIIDYVLRGIRDSLKLRLRGARLSAQSLQSVQSQVAVELAAHKDDGILEDFSPPRVYSSASDPSVCVVELAFQVAHVLSQIHVTAHITV